MSWSVPSQTPTTLVPPCDPPRTPGLNSRMKLKIDGHVLQSSSAPVNDCKCGEIFLALEVQMYFSTSLSHYLQHYMDYRVSGKKRTFTLNANISAITWQIFTPSTIGHRAEFRRFLKTSILRPSEAFFGHGEENQKVLGLNFTPGNTL